MLTFLEMGVIFNEGKNKRNGSEFGLPEGKDGDLEKL
jgi:hypothetical protein